MKNKTHNDKNTHNLTYKKSDRRPQTRFYADCDELDLRTAGVEGLGLSSLGCEETGIREVGCWAGWGHDGLGLGVHGLVSVSDVSRVNPLLSSSLPFSPCPVLPLPLFFSLVPSVLSIPLLSLLPPLPLPDRRPQTRFYADCDELDLRTAGVERLGLGSLGCEETGMWTGGCWAGRRDDGLGLGGHVLEWASTYGGG